MSFAHSVAQVMAIVYISVAISAITGAIDYNKLFKEITNSPAITYLSGLAAVIIGYVIIYHHNVWVKDWTVLITLVGWIALVKGVMFIAFPQLLKHFEFMVKKKSALVPALCIVLGVVFAYFGFMA